MYEMILIVKYRVEVLFMVTRIFILDDSLVFEKMLVEILEESRILLSPWKFGSSSNCVGEDKFE
ncbi:hypothetical protein GJ652_12445 [Enterococcus faecium]|nr:hypothetical protein GJ652_12445 [Enterococcus faecium]